MKRVTLGGAAALTTAAVVTATIVIAIATAVNGVARWSPDQTVADAARSLAAGDAHGAARTLLTIVAERPSDPVSHYYLGLAYIRSGLPSVAIAQLAEAARLEPRDARVRGALGQAYRAAGTPHLALNEFLEAVTLAPREPSYRAEAGNVLLDDGRVDEALAQLREAVRLRPTAADVRVLLGMALCRAGDADGMALQLHRAEQIAAGEPLGELAHQLAESRPRACTAVGSPSHH